jgi:hypothetical protein
VKEKPCLSVKAKAELKRRPDFEVFIVDGDKAFCGGT